MDILNCIDELADVLEKTIKSVEQKRATAIETAQKDSKSNGLSQSRTSQLPNDPIHERGVEQIRSSLRVIVAINKIEEIGQNRKWVDFTSRLQKYPVTSELLIELGQEIVL